MKKLTLALSLILLLSALTGCSNIPTTASSTTAPETTAPPTTASPVTMPNIVELESFLVLSGNWHKKALTSLYESPKDVDLFLLFRDGFDDELREYTDEEKALLRDYTGFLTSRPLIRLPAEKMDAALQEAFGLTLAETNGVGLEHFVYLPDTGCYYTTALEDPDIRGMSVLSMKVLENNCLQVRYTTETAPLSGKTGILTLQVNADGTMQILSNLRKDEPATGDPDPFANLPLDTPDDYLAVFPLMDGLNPWDHSSITVVYRRSLLRSYFLKDPEMFIRQMPNDSTRLYHLAVSLRYALRPTDFNSVKAVCQSMRSNTSFTGNEQLAATMVLEQLLISGDERKAIVETELEGRTEITDYTTAVVRFGVHPGVGYAPQATPDFLLYSSYEKFREYRESLLAQKDHGLFFDADITDALCPESFRDVTARFDEAFFKENILIQIYTLSPADSLPQVTKLTGKKPDIIVGSLLVHLEYDPNQPDSRDDVSDRMIYIAVPKAVYEQYTPEATADQRRFWGLNCGVSILLNDNFNR